MGSFLELIFFLRIFAFKFIHMLEIERKFLVLNDDFIKESSSKSSIIQGYIFSNPEKSVRVRIKKNCDISEAFITIKGNGNESGTTRDEFEYSIPVLDAESMFDLCDSMLIKTRYEVPIGEHVYEVDIFKGRNSGLIVAEIELDSEDEKFLKPSWLGEEVTGDVKYYNSSLSVNQFRTW